MNVRCVIQKLPSNFKSTLRSFYRQLKTTTDVKGKSNDILYNLLVSPIKEDLNTHIVFIADKMFAQLPFESLKQNGKYLVEDYFINYHYSLNLWRQSINDDASFSDVANKICAVAPGFKKGILTESIKPIRSALSDSIGKIYRDNLLMELKSSLEEVKQIEQICKSQNIDIIALRGQDATEKEFRSVINESNIFHFATHSIALRKNPHMSGLFLYQNKMDKNNYLNDGFLSLDELFGLNVKAKLIILSSCDSGKGIIQKGEGIIALPRGFLYAGTPNVIASLWKVHDEKTKDLMVGFYKYLLVNKCSYSEALSLSKRDCIKKGFIPMDWASFILIGK